MAPRGTPCYLAGSFYWQMPMTRLRFRLVLAFSCWMGENDLKTLCVDANFFENGEKKLRFQTKTDTCGRDLRPRPHEDDYKRKR